MAVELAPHNIRVNSVAPGSIATPRIPASPERVKRTEEGLIPFKRLGTTDEVAKAVLFLLSDMASYVTGHTLLVDGGWMAAYAIGVWRASGSRGRRTRRTQEGGLDRSRSSKRDESSGRRR